MSITSTEARHFSFAVKTTPDNVGPGMYNINVKPQRYRAQIPFGSTTRRDLFPELREPVTGPGPGDYNPSDLSVRARSASSCFSLGPDRKYFQDEKNTPAPCAYSSLAVWAAPKYVAPMNTRKPVLKDREPFQNATDPALPGPGQYNPQKPEKQHGVAFSASRAPQREPVYFNGIPGPAEYNIDRSLTESSKIPGVKQSAMFRSKDRRDIFPKAQHDATMLNHTAWRAETPTKRPFGGLAKRSVDFVTTETPDTIGPGSYNIVEVPKQRTNHCNFGADGPSYVAQLAQDNPGPGYYVSVPKTRNQGLLPRAKKPDLWAADIKYGPSPGQYNITEGSEYERKAQLRIANPAFKDKEERDCLTNKAANPGPAAYYARVPSRNTAKEFSKAPRFTEKTYVGNEQISDTPAPSQYGFAEKPTKSLGGVMSRASRFGKQKKSSVPGPDAYQDADKCNMIKQSFNVRFDPKNQPVQKFGLDE